MKNNNGNNRHSQKNYSKWLLDYDCNFYIEKYFQDIFYMERKRAKRSNGEILLMLVNISGLFNGNGGSKHLKTIAQILSSLKRETDIAGWYKYNEIMGVIFPETGELNKNLISRKIHNELSHKININQLNKIKLTFHVIPKGQ